MLYGTCVLSCWFKCSSAVTGPIAYHLGQSYLVSTNDCIDSFDSRKLLFNLPPNLTPTIDRGCVSQATGDFQSAKTSFMHAAAALGTNLAGRVWAAMREQLTLPEYYHKVSC